MSLDTWIIPEQSSTCSIQDIEAIDTKLYGTLVHKFGELERDQMYLFVRTGSFDRKYTPPFFGEIVDNKFAHHFCVKERDKNNITGGLNWANWLVYKNPN